MKNQKQKEYEAPETKHQEVELENGFMKASIFEEGEGHDKGVSIQGHEFGNSCNYFDNNNGIEGWNEWDK